MTARHFNFRRWALSITAPPVSEDQSNNNNNKACKISRGSLTVVVSSVADLAWIMISMTRHVAHYQTHRLISSICFSFCRCRTSEKLIHLLKIHVVPVSHVMRKLRRPSFETGSALLRKSSSDVLKKRIFVNFTTLKSMMPVASFLK